MLPSLVRVYSHLGASGEAHTIIRAKSLNELTAVWVPSPQSFPYRSLAFWNKFGSMHTE